MHLANFSVLHLSLSITSSRRLKTSLRYLNLLVLMQMLITGTMKKIRCELLTCWLPITSRKPIEKRIRIRKEISSQKLRCYIQQLTKSSCMTRYVLDAFAYHYLYNFLIFIFTIFHCRITYLDELIFAYSRVIKWNRLTHSLISC